MKSYIVGIVLGVLFGVAMVAAQEEEPADWSMANVDACPTVMNDSVSKADAQKSPPAKTVTTTVTTTAPRRTLTLEDAVELELIQTPPTRVRRAAR